MSFGIKRSASFYGAIPQTTQTKNRVPFWSRPPGRVFPFGKLKRTAFCIASRRFSAARGEHHQGRFKAAFAAVPDLGTMLYSIRQTSASQAVRVAKL
jgi:hypothetical protein